MKPFLMLLLACFLFAFDTKNADPITPKDRELLVKDLKETQDILIQSVKGLSPEQLKFKASADSWSIAQCVEHILLTEDAFMGMIRQSLQTAADSSKKKEVSFTDEGIIKTVPDRTNKVKTFDALQPTGKYTTADEAINTFSGTREKNIGFAETTQEDLRNHFITLPGLGTMDTYQALLFMSGHCRRHVAQMEEVKNADGYPK